MCACTWVVRLHVEGSKTEIRPVFLHAQIAVVFWFSNDHDGAKGAEPVAEELLGRHGLLHGVRVPAYYFRRELIVQRRHDGARDLGGGEDGIDCGMRHMVAEDNDSRL